ncbi:MAG: Probable signal peptide protein [uncultured Paraburkholderia sp.]|nr:MAG: Probable signal peptide protein [uncultured Paraburkholderia sp.]CAH2782564.1 MAG: Probable signal peptide protein [uncultured Paraburkholderia sp.]CAH2915753.1 MAG: Probable signal peptide protein [uncultured Paraburkholderia sp.]CAH2917101.1 MAG: Probable signal peptide protein [uncultured Paraburkholderia sp.]
MSPKRLLCAAVLCLCFAGPGAFAQNPAPGVAPSSSAAPSVAPGVAPAPEAAPDAAGPADTARPGAPADAPAAEASAAAMPTAASATRAASAAASAAAPSAKTAAPQSAATPMTGPVRNVVLVHGAFVDGSIWNGVVAKLQQKGYRVSSVQNPLTSLADDVAATRRVLARQQGPTILVGHSWGSVVITEAGANAPNVAGLVYVAAIAPELHESTMDLLKRAAPMPAGESIIKDASGFLWLDRSKYHADFAADVPENLTRVLSAAQVPIAASAFGETVSQVAWKEKPSWYVLTTKDRAVSPEVERFMAERMGAKIVPVASSHLAPVSHAGAIADVIERAARELSRQQ